MNFVNNNKLQLEKDIKTKLKSMKGMLEYANMMRQD